MTALADYVKRSAAAVLAWFDAASLRETPARRGKIEWLRILPFICMHLMCLGVFWVGCRAEYVVLCLSLYALRMVAITGFYHRYFSHRTFRTSRVVQFLFAALGASAVQRGPLWWAAHHRHHHTHSDDELDTHSPHRHGFVWSHIGWFLSRENFPTKTHLVPDLAKYPELRLLDRFDVCMPVLLAALLFAVGGVPWLIWGFFVSTVLLYHGTFTVNSLTHVLGKRRYATKDRSRNNWLVALLTFGEGWHNNHHHFPGSVRQGFYWWEFDPTYYVLRLLGALGLIWDLKTVPDRIRDARRNAAATV